MAYTPINSLPPAPQRNDSPEDFVTKADAHVAALPTWTTQVNNAGTYIDGVGAQVDADKATTLGYKNDAEVSKIASEAAKDLSEKWASENEDVVVANGEFSSKHYAIKAEVFKDTAQTAAAAAQSAAGLPSLVDNAGKSLIVNGAEDGVLWGLPANATFTEFTTSSTFTPAEGSSYIYVEIINGGSSGAASIRTISSGAVSSGAGGSFLSFIKRCQDLPSTIPVIVGVGGASRTQNTTGTNPGAIGGASSFNGVGPRVGNNYTVTAYGQQSHGNNYNGGCPRVSINSPTGGSCGVGGAGGGSCYDLSSGAGGLSDLHGDGGDGVVRTNQNATASDGEFPGGGGGAAAVYNSDAGSYVATSGAGGDGVVRVWEW